MANTKPESRERVIIKADDLGKILKILKRKSYKTIGPTLQEKAIIYDEIRDVDDLPIGWTDKQEKGSYRLERRTDGAYFGYNVGPHSWKKFLSPPEVRLWSARKSENGFDLHEDDHEIPNYAFIGVRSCDLHAIQTLDNVFLGGNYQDKIYGDRRQENFIVAVNCTEAGGTCFCASLGTGPKSDKGFDLALTEIINDEGHYFVVEIGSEKGSEIMDEVSTRKAGPEMIHMADLRVEKAAKSMGRQLNTDRLRDLLFANYQHPEWEEVANRCLSCANCTMVCPTCFCHTNEEVTDLDGNNAERWRRWDSCFTLDFTYIHGGSVRKSTRSRYRQWMTHKLASWHDQFGTSGCVGCGRCITWCPVGIDITEIADTIRKSGELPDKTVEQPQ
ncbi:MAG TPA: 4Fe-4S dicluster domain-containing protein [Balneolales bacterium]|nr:4Fe-4S dicluster domain-containing protein [Balneolales bacterium]